MPHSNPWPFAFTPKSDWGQAYTSFLRRAHEKSGSTHTLAHYRQVLTCFFSEPAKSPEQYTRADVEQFLHSPGQANGRKGQPVAAGTINNRLSILNSFYSYAGGYGIAQADSGMLTPLLNRMAPTAGLRQLSRDRPPYRALTTEELRRFFAAIPGDTAQGLRDRALFLTYFFTARRRDEILRLRWGDITEETLIGENGPRPGVIYRFTGKGHSRQSDSAELPRPAYDAILLYLRHSGRLATIRVGDALFTADPAYQGRSGYDPKRPLAPHTVWRKAKKYARAAGIDEHKCTPHAFRHSSARIRYEQGSDIREIQQVLRHKSLATTDIYLRQLMTTADPGALLLVKLFDE